MLSTALFSRMQLLPCKHCTTSVNRYGGSRRPSRMRAWLSCSQPKPTSLTATPSTWRKQQAASSSADLTAWSSSAPTDSVSHSTPGKPHARQSTTPSPLPPQSPPTEPPPSTKDRKDWGIHELITAWSLKAQDIQELERLYHQNRMLNTANLVAMLTQLSWLYPDKDTSISLDMQRRVLEFADTLAQHLVAKTGVRIHERVQAVSALARLGVNQPDRYAHLISHLEAGLPHFSKPSLFAETTWSFAKMGHDPGQAWIAEMLDASRPHLPSFNLAELANVKWALAKWGYRPGAVWMTLFFRRLMGLLSSPGVGSTQGSTESSSSESSPDAPPGADPAAPPARGGKAVAARLAKLPRGSRGDVASLTSLTWGLAVLRCLLPPPVADRIMGRAQALFPCMSGQAFANLAWALCFMGVRPKREWIEQLLVHSRKPLAENVSGMSFSNLAWALAYWRVKPGAAWLDDLVRCATPMVPRMLPDELMTLLQALSDLEHHPPKPWVGACLETYHKNLQPGQPSGGSPVSIARLLWALSRLLQTRSEPSEPGGSVKYAGPGTAWVKFYRPILQDLLEVCAGGLHRLPPPLLVDLAVAVADLGVHPGVEWLVLHDRCCNMAIGHLTAYQLNLLTNAYKTISQLDPPTLAAGPSARVRASASATATPATLQPQPAQSAALPPPTSAYYPEPPPLVAAGPGINPHPKLRPRPTPPTAQLPAAQPPTTQPPSALPQALTRPSSGPMGTHNGSRLPLAGAGADRPKTSSPRSPPAGVLHAPVHHQARGTQPTAQPPTLLTSMPASPPGWLVADGGGHDRGSQADSQEQTQPTPSKAKRPERPVHQQGRPTEDNQRLRGQYRGAAQGTQGGAVPGAGYRGGDGREDAMPASAHQGAPPDFERGDRQGATGRRQATNPSKKKRR